VSWYGEGLRFSCRQCGKCCRGPEPGYVWVDVEDVDRLARRLGLSRDDFGRRFLRQVEGRLSLVERPNADCIFWEEGRGCTVYEDRPPQCRTFPFWPEVIATEASWRARSWCHGVGSGRLYAKDEIEGLARGEGETRGA
jgi:Fe-S-cluster containining protein